MPSTQLSTFTHQKGLAFYLDTSALLPLALTPTGKIAVPRLRRDEHCVMTTQNETVRDELKVRRVFDNEMRRALNEVSRHSLGRTGKVARAIEAGLAALRNDAALASGARAVLEEFAWRVSESSPSVHGVGISMRCVTWSDAVYALLSALRPPRPDPIQELAVVG